MIVIGCDPGLGVKSPTGVAVVNTETREILQLEELRPEKRIMPIHKKLRQLHVELHKIVWDRHFEAEDSMSLLFCIEYFVMRAKGGESLQRLVGALMAALPDNANCIQVQNSTVKKFVGGRGSDSKEEVAQGVLFWFRAKNAAAAKKVEKLIEREKWDLLDALAIAISGYEDFNHATLSS